VDRDPLALLKASLGNQGSVGSDESATETRCADKVNLLGQGNEIHVGVLDENSFGKSTPVGKARLGVMIADMGVSKFALDTSPTAAAKGHRYSLSDAEISNRFANRSDHTRELMAWDMR
jgi:hypothetical protein